MKSDSAINKAHSHMWLVGVAGLSAGLVLLVYVPSLKVISQSLLWFAGFHLIGGITLLGSLYAIIGSRFRRKQDALDFGWVPAWTLGPLLAATVFLSTAVALQLAAPSWWPLAIVLTLFAANAFAGYLIAASTAKPDHAVLPMVNLLPGNNGLVLDGGCGAGRTSIAVARGVAGTNIVALDRFDSDYIEGGGRILLNRNMKLAGISDRVHVQTGDLTDLPFDEEHFDAAVSAHAIDHLGRARETGLREMRRVLKPGGRFLLVVWVPGWAMFAIANILSFKLATRHSWRSMARSVGFEVLDDGNFNGHYFLLLGKPAGEKAGHD